MDVNRDFSELLSAFANARVRYLIVGAHAVAYHAEPRFTKDLDLWVDPSTTNAAKVWAALSQVGAPLKGVTVDDFADPELMSQIGIEPNRIDIMMGISGVRFETAWPARVRSKYGDVSVHIISRTHLLRSKRAAGRPKDLLDITNLTRRRKRQSPAKRRKPDPRE